MYIYENHMGGLYSSEDYIDISDLYCETCGDSDECLGQFSSAKEFICFYREEIDFDGNGGWSPQYIADFVNETFRSSFTEKDIICLCSNSINNKEE